MQCDLKTSPGFRASLQGCAQEEGCVSKVALGKEERYVKKEGIKN